jgi:hypothetical protein
MTFADKLKRFKSERVGFTVETEEIAKGLVEVFQMEHMNHRNSGEPMSISKFSHVFDGTVITNGFYDIGEGVSIGKMHCTGAGLDDVFPVTSQELQRYLKIRKGIQDNSEVYFPTPTREIYDELMNTLDNLGCRWASKDKPMEYDGFTSNHKVRVSDSKVITIDGLNEANESSVVISLASESLTPPQTITIVSDGHHKVTAESNGITAEATCCPTDTFSIAKGTHMVLQRLLEKQKEADVIQELGELTDEEHKFNIGDVVEVVDTGFAPEKTIGLQGVVQEDDDWPFIKFPISIGDDDTWAYNQDNLKLIRRNPCK